MVGEYSVFALCYCVYIRLPNLDLLHLVGCRLLNWYCTCTRYGTSLMFYEVRVSHWYEYGDLCRCNDSTMQTAHPTVYSTTPTDPRMTYIQNAVYAGMSQAVLQCSREVCHTLASSTVVQYQVYKVENTPVHSIQVQVQVLQYPFSFVAVL